VPPKLRVNVSRRLERDLEAIIDRIALDSPLRAEKFRDDVVRIVLGLGSLPLRAPLVPEKSLAGQGYRHLIFGDYRIIFSVGDDVVWAVRVIHGARLLRKRP
jgi:plasmid stabilization system protein ParE